LACVRQPFISHLTGKIKPDADAFEHVVDSLGFMPAVLFLDDNRSTSKPHRVLACMRFVSAGE